MLTASLRSQVNATNRGLFKDVSPEWWVSSNHDFLCAVCALAFSVDSACVVVCVLVFLVDGACVVVYVCLVVYALTFSVDGVCVVVSACLAVGVSYTWDEGVEGVWWS